MKAEPHCWLCNWPREPCPWSCYASEEVQGDLFNEKAMSKWQPIETAPRDGERFIAAEIDEPYPTQCYECWRDKTGQWWESITELDPAPTHWMPMPEPPDA